jgi:hypothetical protein
VAPTWWDDGEVRAVRAHARRLLPLGLDLPGSNGLSRKEFSRLGHRRGRYVETVPNDRVVQAVAFVSDDPALAGTMTMTWAVRAVDGGTRIEITADDVPDGVSADDHAAGLTSSLDNLAGYVES